ncbi:formin-binding protein 4-like isoform X1 [Osmia bicornis bicornis]|uniref:formin-binding protein 4-like isoform X1 n=1 Tax=Osmia bicornis bicornis TaxID=1437191 RepID=UPI001EAF4E0C|nr:formin-binding protein 4-like isoform X1 [Osmia bicornis bicornis]
MKRRQRRPVLELNQSHSGSHGEYVQNKRRQISNDYCGQNVPANSLANILCHYNSDSDTEESKKDVCKLDDQVNNFFKEIQLIAPKQPVSDESVVNPSVNSNTCQTNHVNQQALMWRECLDESSGYPYYWHIETNEVTWEMPDELRYLKNNVKSSSIMKQLQESHWVDFSSVTYQQSQENIPEGMIPREVVARNRNRYICNETAKKREAQSDQEVANTSDTMDNDSDDGKIEMITSYGSDESDSDTPDDNQSKNKAPSATESTSTGSTVKAKNIETYPSTTPVIQPQLPTVPQNSAPDYENKDTVEYKKPEVSLDLKPTEDTETKYLKAQVKQSVTQETEEKTNNDNQTAKESFVKKSSNKHNTDVELDFRVSLVPGYDEDSDAEEEPETKQERKALFPIPLTDNVKESTPLSSKIVLDESQTISSIVLINSADNESSSERKSTQDQEDEQVSEKPECKEEPAVKAEEDVQKTNKFLDNLSGRSKFFQRKKRIAFDVTPSKTKTVDESESTKTEAETQREESNSCDEPITDHREHNDTTSENTTENAANFKDEPNNTLEGANVSSETSNESKEDEGEVNLLSQIVLEKLKFLSEGKPSVSPVQMMSIQLQTLCIAWEGGYLEKSYLRRWLSDTSHELERLEQDAAPPGWLCQWDRSHKRYYYQNTTTGVTQWTYPDTGIAGGAEEMEICSTPPPTEQEEMILPVEEEGVKLKSKKLQESDETSQDTTAPRNSDIEAPPPPQISNPSPPPPPKIYAEDLKRDKRKQDKCNDKLDSKKQRPREEGTIITEVKLEDSVAPSHSSALLSPQPTSLVNVTNAEPLPPGVDLTEAPYEIPATALKRIIYGAVQPQGSALYDATARDPTVPILSHPAAIVQEHYLQYPAYHQHLHAPAALVLPHKHSVQPAIQLIPDYTPIYTNHKIIEKPPVKTAKESLVSALDSFYNDIARIENTGPEKTPQRPDTTIAEPSSVPAEETKLETEQEPLPAEIAVKERKRKKARVGISKKHKEMSSMVAKWQKVQQNFENT